jgi:hypothetical protein
MYLSFLNWSSKISRKEEVTMGVIDSTYKMWRLVKAKV